MLGPTGLFHDEPPVSFLSSPEEDRARRRLEWDVNVIDTLVVDGEAALAREPARFPAGLRQTGADNDLG